jgi:hypothetical protein
MEALLVRAFLSFRITKEKENVTVFSGEASEVAIDIINHVSYRIGIASSAS